MIEIVGQAVRRCFVNGHKSRHRPTAWHSALGLHGFVLVPIEAQLHRVRSPTSQPANQAVTQPASQPVSQTNSPAPSGHRTTSLSTLFTVMVYCLGSALGLGLGLGRGNRSTHKNNTNQGGFTVFFNKVHIKEF